MKNPVLWAILLLAWMLPALPLWADADDEAQPRSSLYLNIGNSLPSSPSGFSGNWEGGGNFGIGLGFGLFRGFQLVVDFNGYNFPADGSRYITLSGGEYRDALFLVNGRLRFIPGDNPITPYGILGIGFSTLTEDALAGFDSEGDSVRTPASSRTSIGGRAGLGLDFKLSDNAAVFLELDGVGDQYIRYGSARLGGKFNL